MLFSCMTICKPHGTWQMEVWWMTSEHHDIWCRDFHVMSRSLLLVPTNSPRPALAAELRHKDRVLVTALVAEPRHSHGRRRTIWLTHASRGRGAGRGRQRGQGGIRRRPTRHPHLGIVLAIKWFLIRVWTAVIGSTICSISLKSWRLAYAVTIRSSARVPRRIQWWQEPPWIGRRTRGWAAQVPIVCATVGPQAAGGVRTPAWRRLAVPCVSPSLDRRPGGWVGGGGGGVSGRGGPSVYIMRG